MRHPDEFDKKTWLREYKQLKKDLVTEDRERYRPLLNIKRDMKEFFEEIEKEDKKTDISINKEFSQLYQVIHKQRQEVEQAKNMITLSMKDPA